MKASIIECSFGIIAFNEENKLVEKALFSKKPQNAAKAMMKIENGKMIEEVSELIDVLKKSGYDFFVLENGKLADEIKEKFDVRVKVSKPSDAGELLRSSIERFAIKTGFVKDAEEFAWWTRNIAMETAKLKVKSAGEKRDLIIAQAIQTLDDLDKVLNLFMGRVREWYGVSFPELDRLLDKHETYARLVLNLGNKDNFTVENLMKEDVPDSKAEQIVRATKASMGAALAEADLAQIQALCKSVLSLYQLRQSLENYLEKAMDEVAPNVRALTGALLGARLIAISGGLTNLARRPASTIQVLGAEKALFRSLKTGARPPKHGIIFQHASLHDAKRWHRGKIARALAGKLAIAARVDAFGGKYIGEKLKASLDKRIEEIREKYVEPPPVTEKKPKRQKNRWRKSKRAHKG
jgi:nucleolar protein 56